MITLQNIANHSPPTCTEWENMSLKNKLKSGSLINIFPEKFMIYVFKNKIKLI